MKFNITIYLNEKGRKIVGADTREFEINSDDPYLDNRYFISRELEEFLNENFPCDELISHIEVNRSFKDAKVGDIVRIVGLNYEGRPEHEVITEIDMVAGEIITTKEGLPYDGDLITSMFYRNNGKAAWEGRSVHIETPSPAEIHHYNKINRRAKLEKELIQKLFPNLKLCEKLENRLNKNGKLFASQITTNQLSKIVDMLAIHDED